MTRSAHRGAPRRRRAAVVVAAACLVAIGLAGCTGTRLGAAAVIDGRPLTTDELQSKARAYLDVVPGADASSTQLAILQQAIVSAVITEVARDDGVRVSAGKIASERAVVLRSTEPSQHQECKPSWSPERCLITLLAQSQQPSVLAPSDIDRWVKDRLLFDAIAAEICGCDIDTAADADAQQALSAANDQLRKKSASMDIEVSPRYGRWEPDRGVTPLVSGGLSKTVDELRAGGA